MPIKILVVDDEPNLKPLIQQIFRKKIKQNEIGFVFARDGLEALEKLRVDPDIDIILTDIKMPNMGGLELLAKLKKLKPDLKPALTTVIISAYGDAINIRKAMNDGAFDFLTKPIDYKDLRTTVEKTVRHVQESRQVIERELFMQEKLRKTNEQLEQRVAERTATLSQTNMLLKREIAERKQAEQKLKSFAAELERSNAELQDFAFIASHDLHEPLRKIQVFGNLFKAKYSKVLDKRGHDYLERMQNAAQRMQIFIDDLLAFSRVTTRAQPFTPVSLRQVATEVIEDLEGRIRQVKGQVELGELATIDADPTQIRQLLQNLISNGLKFHQPDAPPIVKVSGAPLNNHTDILPEAEFYQIMVSDNGIGFDEKHCNRIFGVFQRLHTHSTYDGTGVGLAICRKVVERHSGSIVAQSKPGQGAIFIITLPVKQLHMGMPPKDNS